MSFVSHSMDRLIRQSLIVVFDLGEVPLDITTSMCGQLMNGFRGSYTKKILVCTVASSTLTTSRARQRSGTLSLCHDDP